MNGLAVITPRTNTDARRSNVPTGETFASSTDAGADAVRSRGSSELAAALRPNPSRPPRGPSPPPPPPLPRPPPRSRPAPRPPPSPPTPLPGPPRHAFVAIFPPLAFFSRARASGVVAALARAAAPARPLAADATGAPHSCRCDPAATGAAPGEPRSPAGVNTDARVRRWRKTASPTRDANVRHAGRRRASIAADLCTTSTSGGLGAAGSVASSRSWHPPAEDRRLVFGPRLRAPLHSTLLGWFCQRKSSESAREMTSSGSPSWSKVTSGGSGGARDGNATNVRRSTSSAYSGGSSARRSSGGSRPEDAQRSRTADSRLTTRAYAHRSTEGTFAGRWPTGGAMIPPPSRVWN